MASICGGAGDNRDTAVERHSVTASDASCTGDATPQNGDFGLPEPLHYDATSFDPAALTAPACATSAAARFMDLAFAAARDALRHQEVPIGAVLVRAGRLLAAGRNTVNETKNATRHAEINCVDLVYSRSAAGGVATDALWAATDVFVTVEPCVMCAAALTQLGVRSVTYGAANQRFGGCGSVLDVPGDMMPSRVEFRQDEGRVEEAIALLKEFYKGENPNAPQPAPRPQG